MILIFIAVYVVTLDLMQTYDLGCNGCIDVQQREMLEKNGSM